MNESITVEKTVTKENININSIYYYFKRFGDFFMSLILLIVLLIPIIIISILIKLEDKGPVLFKQKRTGKDGRTFNLHKFRSMSVNNDVLNFKEENHLTKVGKFLRKTSLDEIPQLFDILTGKMSFIGPRPWIPEYYENMTPRQRQRVKVLPGLTGLAQVNGRNGISIVEKINYDLEYVKHFSLKQDIKIAIKTIMVVFKKENAEISKSGIKEELETLKMQKVK